jgi:hypothetical protein
MKTKYLVLNSLLYFIFFIIMNERFHFTLLDTLFFVVCLTIFDVISYILTSIYFDKK